VPIAGSIATMTLPDLLQWLGSSGKTGVLRFERRRLCKRVLLSGGVVVACSSQDPRELLGHFLVSRGKLDEETLRGALERKDRTDKPLGCTLVELGVLSAHELTAYLTAQAEEIIFSLFEWPDAVFRFDDEPIDRAELPFPIELRIEDVLLRGMQRTDEVAQIRTVFDNPGIVLRRTGRQPPDAVFANRMASRLFDSIDGERTVADILLLSHASEYMVTKFLFELHRTGMVEITEIRTPGEPAPAGPAPVAEPPAGTRSPLQVDLEVAGNLISRGEFEASLEILDKAYKAHPGDEALRRLLAEAEACFIDKAYRHFVPADRVPVLLLPVDQLTGEQLSPEEFFLLSRMTGDWDVKAILQISPIREVDALRVLKRMREKGLIELRDPAG